MKINVEIKKLDNLQDLPLPSYATIGSAGMDLLAAIDKDMVVKPMERVLVPTGISIALPMGFEAQIRPRSGMAFKHGITVVNTPGTIDSDYRGEICVPIINLSQVDFTIERGMRVAQMVIAEHSTVNWNIVSSLSSTERAEGGFGSTGMSADKKVA